MPNKYTLAIGDSIKILNVPKADLEQRLREPARKKSDMPHTASVYENIIQQCPVVIIDNIDEYHQPWFSVFIRENNALEYHSLVVIDDEHWEIVHRINSNNAPPIEHQIAQVTLDIDSVMENYEQEYQALAQHSEVLYDEQQALKQEYAKLDKKTGLNALFERLAKLKHKT